jgi:seryl-tRNA synthetase
LLVEKAKLEEQKRKVEEDATKLEVQRDMTLKRIGNYVHESVPVSNNEVNLDF